MKKLLFIIYFSIAALFLTSCGGHFFNPRYYYNKSSSSLSSGDGGVNIPEVEPPEEIPADEDPFKVNEDYNNPNYGGYEASKFDKWLFKASFRDDKLPIYNFFEDNTRSWIPGGMDWNNIPANYYQGKNGENTAQGYEIKNLTVYKYDRDNPLYDDKGYLPGRMDRFRFYSINGESGVATINAPLKQYLIAVDTYSKFVFAFGKITKVQDFVGQKVPIGFEAIELHGDKKHFYEYDPIGYVDKTGEVFFYQHYIDEFVANPTSYTPKQHGYDKIAEHNKTKPGKSPYVPLNSNTEASEEDKKIYQEEIKKYVNEYKYRNYSGYQKSPTGEKDQIDLEAWKKSGYLGLSLTLYTYNLTDDGNTLTVTTKEFNSTSSSPVKRYKLSMINTSYKATYTNESDPSDTLSISIVKDDSGNNTISVSGTLLDPNFQDYGPIFVDRARNTEFTNPEGAYYTFICTFADGLGATLKNFVYKFSSDGTEFTMSYTHNGEPRTQKFRLARFDSDAANTWTAKYECTTETGTLGNYARVVFRNGEGTTNPGPDEIGTVMRVSMTLHSIDFAESPTINTGLDLVGTRVTQ